MDLELANINEKSCFAIENVNLSDSEQVANKITFKELGVMDEICSVCTSLGYTFATEIQSQVLPHALAGKDIIGIAETGSGKTAAFVIPILQALLEKPAVFFALVLAPTRELAFQIKEQFESIGSQIGVKCAILIGGTDMVNQSVQLAKRPNVIIATPGRILDHLENTKGFSLRSLKYLVFDEADRLLNLDFEKEMSAILRVIPADRKTYLYSATMTKKVAKLNRACLSNPVKVEVSRKYQTVKSLRQEYVFIPAKFRDVYTVALLNDLAGKSIMIFTNTIRSTHKVELMLKALGFAVIGLHGKMPQDKRLAALNKFKTGRSSILVATDVASRGLDIPAVNVVLNFDVPQKSKDYIHRVGRTARAGRKGLSISIVTQYDVELFQRIEHLIGFKLKEYKIKQDEVMIFYDRVNEAQKMALIELKERDEKKQKRKKRKWADLSKN